MGDLLKHFFSHEDGEEVRQRSACNGGQEQMAGGLDGTNECMGQKTKKLREYHTLTRSAKVARN
jgi:hypothetical protein